MRHYKQLFSLTLILILIWCISGGNLTLAQGAPTFEVGAHTGACGDTIQVPVLVKENPGIAAIKLKVTYDTSRLELLEVVYGSDWNGNFQKPQRLTSPVSLTWYNGTDNYTVSNSVFATLTFRVLENAELGEAAISMTYDPNNVYNIAEDNISFTIQNGKITVKSNQACGHTSTTKKYVLNGDGTHTVQTVCNVCKETASATSESCVDENRDKVCDKCNAVLSSSPSTTPVFEIGTHNACPGDMVQVPVLVKHNPGISAMKLKVAFDTNRLVLVSVDYGSGWGGNFQQPQKLTSPVSLTWYDGTGNYTVSDSVFATLTFRIPDNAPTGDAAIRVTYDPDNVYNFAEKNIAFEIQNGQVAISELAVSVGVGLMESTSSSAKIRFSNTGTIKINASFVISAYDAKGRMIGCNMVTDELEPLASTESTVSCVSGSTIATVKGFVLDPDSHSPLTVLWEEKIN